MAQLHINIPKSIKVDAQAELKKARANLDDQNSFSTVQPGSVKSDFR